MSDQLDLLSEPAAVDLTAGLGELAIPPGWDMRSLVEAREEMARLLVDGAICPCCDRIAKVYRWTLYATAVRMLAGLYRVGGTTEYVHANTVKGKGQGDGARLRQFGLAEEEPDRRPDGGKSGWWRVTDLGERFLRGQATIPRWIYVYNKRVLRTGGDRVTIHEALGKVFDYDAMMAGTF